MEMYVSRRYFFCGSFMFFSVLCLLCLCACLFICALWLSLSHWYPGSGVIFDCIDSCSLHPYLLLSTEYKEKNEWPLKKCFLSDLHLIFLMTISFWPNDLKKRKKEPFIPMKNNTLFHGPLNMLPLMAIILSFMAIKIKLCFNGCQNIINKHTKK